MKVIEQLKYDLLAYPSFIKNKWCAYHQWFCVSGNELQWVNGELIDTEKPNISPLSINDVIDEYFDLFEDEISENVNPYRAYKYQIDELKTKMKMIFCLEGRMNDFTQLEELCTLDDYSPLCNIPSDIKDDWKEAVNEFLSWMLSNKDKLNEETKTRIEKLFNNTLL